MFPEVGKNSRKIFLQSPNPHSQGSEKLVGVVFARGISTKSAIMALVIPESCKKCF